MIEHLLWVVSGFAAIGIAAYLYGKSLEFKVPVETTQVFEHEGKLYDRRYWKLELRKPTEKKWWDPTYGFTASDPKDLPEDERRKLKGWKDD